jgi:GNAT superfamily N-acetyltransferase
MCHGTGMDADRRSASSPCAQGRRSPVEVRPIQAEDLPRMVGVVGGADGTGCWCRRFTADTTSDKRRAFEAEVRRSSEPIGLVAVRENRCVGFSRVVRRHSLAGVMANRALSRLYAEDTVSAGTAWWISCFAVSRPERGQGVGVALLNAAIDHARSHGGEVLDGHPVDVARLASRPSPSAIFTGTMSMFVAAGFHEIGRTYPSRPVMRARVRPV